MPVTTLPVDRFQPCSGGSEQQQRTRMARLLAQIFVDAPLAVRRHMLENLIRPLGALSLVVVADGIFARMRFRSGWEHLDIRLEDVQPVQAPQVAALAEHVQQVSIEAVDALASWLTASPLLVGSAAAALLATLLVQRSRERAARATHTGSGAASTSAR